MEVNLPPRRRFQPGDEAKEGSLAGAGGADEDEDFSSGDLQVDFTKRDDGTGKGLRHVVEGEMEHSVIFDYRHRWGKWSSVYWDGVWPEDGIMTNEMIGARLLDHARQLTREGDNLYRIRAYRHAGFEVARIARPLREVFAESGRKGLEGLPGIGRSIAVTIVELLSVQEVETRKVA